MPAGARKAVGGRRAGLVAGLLCGVLLTPVAGAAGPWEIEAPRVRAKAWVLMDYHSGQTLAAGRADERVQPASLTKLMTAYLAYQALRAGELTLGERVTVSRYASGRPGARMFVEPEARVPVEDLIKGMLIQSGNDAAVALAERIAGSEEQFAALMNAEAERLGLTDTHFANATGLHAADHYSTAHDLSRLAAALLRDYPEYRGWYAQKDFSYNGITQHNRNALLWRDIGVDGIKTGHTRASGYCLIASAEREHMRLIATVIGADSERDRTEAGQRLLDFGFARYETRLLYQAHAPTVNVRVWQGESDDLPLGIERNVYLTIPRGTYDRLQAEITVASAQVAPISAGQQVGTLRLNYGSVKLVEYPLVALRAVAIGNPLQRVADRIRMWLQ